MFEGGDWGDSIGSFRTPPVRSLTLRLYPTWVPAHCKWILQGGHQSMTGSSWWSSVSFQINCNQVHYNRNRMLNPVLQMPSNYEPYQLAIATATLLYMSLFVMTSNHLVFKPKVEQLLEHSGVAYTVLSQFLVDILSNLPHLSFILSSLLFFQDDNCLSTIIYSDISWTGLWLSIVAFKAIEVNYQKNARLLLLKNIVFLVLAYLTIWLHYATNTLMLSLGLILILLYLLNWLANSYEDKFVASMEYLFAYKIVKQPDEEYTHCSHLPSPECLANSCPVSRQEVEEHMTKTFPKLKQITLNTKRIMVQNMFKIALAVNLSKQKSEQQAKSDIRNYYGTFNGTVVEKAKKVVLEKGNTHEQSSQDDVPALHNSPQEVDSHNSVLFYIFPVRLFQGSKTLSVLVSMLINLGLGVLLSVVLRMSQSLSHGQYFQIVFGILLLPALPSVSRGEFMTSMVLSSLWRYALYGLFISVVAFSSDGLPYYYLVYNAQLSFIPLIQTVGLILSSVLLFRENSSPYSFCFLWMGCLAASAILIFKHC